MYTLYIHHLGYIAQHASLPTVYIAQHASLPTVYLRVAYTTRVYLRVAYTTRVYLRVSHIHQDVP